MNKNLFGVNRNQPAPIKLKLFCDESGSGDWLYMGVLIVPEEKEDFHFSSHFAPPSRIKQLAVSARQFIEANSCWFHIGLKEMNYTSVKEMPDENQTSVTMRTFGENEADFRKLFVPFTDQAYSSWLEQCIKRFQRIFS